MYANQTRASPNCSPPAMAGWAAPRVHPIATPTSFSIYCHRLPDARANAAHAREAVFWNGSTQHLKG